tara:strand:+ start:41 stop:412 length:372 start_codon:yes stop_codon:yes gene_type:complete
VQQPTDYHSVLVSQIFFSTFFSTSYSQVENGSQNGQPHKKLVDRVWHSDILTPRMADNHVDAQVADSFGEVYNIAVGHKKEVDDAYAKWAAKHGIQVGFPKKKGTGIVYGKKSKEMLDRKKSN